MSSSHKQPLRALGVYAALGALTRGAADAGFAVSAVLSSGPAGAATHALNFGKKIPVHSKEPEWPLKALARGPRLALVYGQPKSPRSGDPASWHQCFVAGTPVLTTRGPVPIERVRKGDLVMTYRNDRFQMVLAASARTHGGPLARVSSGMGAYFTCTPDHPLCTGYDGKPSAWTDAGECSGLVAWQPTSLTFSPPLAAQALPPSGAVTVYNLTVEEDNCYVAGGLLVHNCDRANEVALGLKPSAFAVEIGADAYGARELAEWEERWGEAGYQTTRVLFNAATLGLPQLRRRTLFVAANASLDFSADPAGAPPRALTVQEAIGDLMVQSLSDDPQALHPYTDSPQSEFQEWCRRGSSGATWHVESPGAPSVASLVPHIPAGQHVGKIPDEVYERTYWADRSKPVSKGGRGKPSYFYRRLHWERPSPALPGDIRFVHPEFDRFLTPRESARLMGIPDTFVFAGASSPRANIEAGRSVSPLTAEVLLSQIAACLSAPDEREHRPRVDLSAVAVPRVGPAVRA